MANENENISNDPQSENPEEKQTWLEEALGKIDTDFPLSGGETDEDLEPEEDADDDEFDEEENDDDIDD